MENMIGEGRMRGITPLWDYLDKEGRDIKGLEKRKWCRGLNWKERKSKGMKRL